MREQTIETDGCKLLLDVLKLNGNGKRDNGSNNIDGNNNNNKNNDDGDDNDNDGDNDYDENNSVKFNQILYLFACLLNSSKASYKISTSSDGNKRKHTKTKEKTKQIVTLRN
jgi:hypothetical protein